MGDFYQNGLVTTLHDFHKIDIEALEKRLEKFSVSRPLCLILPSLFSELEGKALENIVNELSKVKYINEIIIGLDRADKEQYKYALEYFSKLPQDHKVLWNDGPRIKAIEKKLKAMNIAPTAKGKGTNVWYCFGYFLSSGKSEAVALHDCDIVTFSRRMLARLVYPVMDYGFSYRFCKGYYYRADDHMLKGRVTRLLVTPLIRALKNFFPNDRFLEYLDSFRYPLAGEFSMRADVVKNMRMPNDWGLEVGILFDVQKNNAVGRVCQVEIADRYEHKHQKISVSDRNAGLAKMCMDISETIFRKLASTGHVFTTELFHSIHYTYYRIALDFVERYHNDSVINGFSHDRHEEETLVREFADIVHEAGENFLKNPTNFGFVPAWKRVISAWPEVMEEFKIAVELDNAGDI